MVSWSCPTPCWNIFCVLEYSKLTRVQQPLSRIISELRFLKLLQPRRPNIFYFSDIKETSGTDFFLIQNRLCLGQNSTLHHVPHWAISSSRRSTKFCTTGLSFIYCCNTEYQHKIHVWFAVKSINLKKERLRTTIPIWALSCIRAVYDDVLYLVLRTTR